MPLKMWQGIVKLSPGSGKDTTKFDYTCLYMANDGVDVTQFKNTLETNFTKYNIPFLQTKFETKQEA